MFALLFRTGVFALISLLMAWTKAEGEESFLSCKSKQKLGPMDINFPLKYTSK